MTRPVRFLMFVVIVSGALVLTFWAASYHTSEFKGGIRVRDSGVLSYPRYHAEVGRVPLWEAGEYQFSLTGLPPGPLDLALDVEEATQLDAASLTSLSTSVKVAVVDSSGGALCEASGNLTDARRRGLGSWVLASSSSHASFWHPHCLQLRTHRLRPYRLTVAVTNVDVHSPRKSVLVVLSGGGNELP